MRHSDVNLTMNTYTDPKLLDVAGAMEALPSLPLPDGTQAEKNTVKAIGTDDLTASQFAPTTGKPCILGSLLDKATANGWGAEESEDADVSACVVKRKSPLTTAVNGPLQERETGFGPATSSLGS